MKPTCIITGATGYIGSHLLKYLLNRGWNIHVVADRKFGYANISNVMSQIHVFEYNGNINSLCKYFASINADVVFHLAAAVITNYKPEQVPVLIQSNIQFGTEILESMRQSGIKRIVTTGSYWQNYHSETYSPVDLYAATKEAFEKILQLYIEVHDFRAVSLRLFDVYGEDDHRPKLWNKLRDIAGTEESIDVSPGKQLLDMIYISDVCTAYEAAYEYLKTDPATKSLQIFGVCTGIQRPLKEIVNLFERILGKPIHVNWGARPYKDREIMHPSTHYPILPNWQAKIELEEGFKKFIL